MNQAVTIQHIGKEISDLFPGRQITRLKINMTVDEIVTAEVTEFVSEEQAKGLMEVVKRYVLVEDTSPRCSVCGEISREWVVRDAIEIQKNEALDYACFKGGDIRSGCSAHPVYARKVWLDGRITEEHDGHWVDVTHA